MSLDITVTFDNLKREANGNVSGKVSLKISGHIVQDFDTTIDAEEFNFPKGGEQKVFDKSVTVKVFTIKLTATVHEHTAGQCCIQGYVHVDAPIGGGIGKDLDPNCKPIPGG